MQIGDQSTNSPASFPVTGSALVALIWALAGVMAYRDAARRPPPGSAPERKPKEPLPTSGDEAWERMYREYESIVAMIQDTGRHIWVINGAYLVTIALIARPLLEKSLNEFEGARLIWYGALGLVLGMLWWGSYERNYRFYALRIDHAKSLEKHLGFSLFTKGAELGDKGVAEIEGRPFRMHPLGGLLSIQWWTRLLILGVVFGSLVVIVRGIVAL